MIRLFEEQCCGVCYEEQLPLTFDEIRKKKYTDGVIFSDDWWYILKDALRDTLEVRDEVAV